MSEFYVILHLKWKGLSEISHILLLVCKSQPEIGVRSFQNGRSLSQIWDITLHGGNDNVKIRLNIVRVAKLFPEIQDTIMPGGQKSV